MASEKFKPQEYINLSETLIKNGDILTGKLGSLKRDGEQLKKTYDSLFNVSEDDLNNMLDNNSDLKDLYDELIEKIKVHTDLIDNFSNKVTEIADLYGISNEKAKDAIALAKEYYDIKDKIDELERNISEEENEQLRLQNEITNLLNNGSGGTAVYADTVAELDKVNESLDRNYALLLDNEIELNKINKNLAKSPIAENFVNEIEKGNGQLSSTILLMNKIEATSEDINDIQSKGVGLTQQQNQLLEKQNKAYGAIARSLKGIWGLVKDGGNKWIEIDDRVSKVGRTIGLSTEQIRGYQKNILANYSDMAAKLGMTTEEMMKFQESYTKNTGRAIMLTNEQVTSLGAMSRLVGDVATNDMVKNMDDFGASTQTATSYLALNMARARSQGLDAQKASEAFSKNVKLASQYTFREGINGISKMTLLSQKLKFNMDSIANAAEKFETVEGAIGTAANLQMLGGSFAAQFGNPLEAMNMAMLDMEGFTNKIVDTFKGKATFNRETGQVDMSAIDKRLLKEAAKQLGISYDEAWNMAAQSAKNGDVERQLNKSQSFSDEDKAWITSKSQYNAETKQHYVTIYNEDGEEQNIDVSQLTEAQLKIAKQQEIPEKAIQGDVHGIHSILKAYVEKEAGDSRSLKEIMTGAKEARDVAMADWVDPGMNAFKDVMGSLTTTVKNFGEIAVVLSGVFAIGKSIFSSFFSESFNNGAKSIASKMFGGNGTSTPPPPGGGPSSGGFWGKTKNAAKSVWNGTKKYGGKALKWLGGTKWGRIISIGTALAGGAALLSSSSDGSQVDKSKLGGREVEPINNKNENTTSSVNQQSQELIELQKHTALLQAIANKQGVDVKTIYENSTFNKTDIEDNSEQTTASSVLSDSMNTTLMASQVGSSKIAAKGLKAVAGRSGLKMAANMGRMAKAANPLGWISLGSGVLKDISGVEEGSGVDKAWSTANAALDGAALGGMIGSIIGPVGTAAGTAVGAAIGGVVGIIDNYGEDIAKATKSVVDGVSGFLFGEDNMTEADKMQQSYEETKLGVVDISDPQLEQKAYIATCKIHDVVISMWHHMNGKQSNGLKEDKGLFGGMSNSVNNVTNNVGNALLNTVSAPFKLIGSLFSGNEETKQVEMSTIDKRLMKNVAKQLNISYDDALSMVSQNVINDNAYTSENPYNTQNYKNSNLTNTNEVNYRNNSYLSEVSVKDINYNNDNVTPKVSVGLPTSIKETSVNNYNNSSYNNIGSNKLDLNVSGTIKLTSDRGGNVDIDFNKLLNNTEFMNNLINIISQDFNKRVNGQRENKNSVISLQNGGYNYNIFNATTNGWA